MRPGGDVGGGGALAIFKAWKKGAGDETLQEKKGNWRTDSQRQGGLHCVAANTEEGGRTSARKREEQKTGKKKIGTVA